MTTERSQQGRGRGRNTAAPPGARERTDDDRDQWGDEASPGSVAPPPTERGRRTRELLVRVARVVFERDGYLDTRVTDITTEAHVAVGTFYTYFSSKQDIFQAVVADVGDEVYAAGATTVADRDPVRVIDQANRQFIRFYRDNTDLMAIVEQVAIINPEFRETRRLLRDRMVQRIERSIRRLQADGTADPSLEPHCAASALASMVSNFAYAWLVLGEPFEEDVAAATLTRLWVQSLGMVASPATVSGHQGAAGNEP